MNRTKKTSGNIVLDLSETWSEQAGEIWQTPVLIVGAGPAGSMAGIRLRQQGVDCLLIDRSYFPRPKLCGGLITELGIKELMDLDWPEKEEILFRSSDITFFEGFAEQEKLLEYQSASLYAVVDREIFDKCLLDQYTALGGKLLEGEKIKEINEAQKTAYTMSGKTIHYQYLIGADGANSCIRRQLNKKRIKLAVCYEQSIDKKQYACSVGRSRTKNGLNVFFEKGQKGFGWLFEGQQLIVAGVGGLNFLKKQGASAGNKEKTEEISGLSVKGGGWMLPYGSMPRKRCTKNIFLIGDAAGYVDPILGEGLSYALTAGKKIVKVLQAENKKKEYKIQFKAEHDMVRWGKIFQSFFFCSWLQPFFFKMMKKHPERIAGLCESFVFQKKLTYRNVLRGVMELLKKDNKEKKRNHQDKELGNQMESQVENQKRLMRHWRPLKHKNKLICLFECRCFKKIWLIFRPLIALIPALLFTAEILIQRGHHLEGDDWKGLIGVILAGAWMYFGQLLIYRHYYRYYRGFWGELWQIEIRNVSSGAKDEKETEIRREKIQKLNKKIHNVIRKADMLILIVWMSIIAIIVYKQSDHLGFILIWNKEDIFWRYFLLICLEGAYLTGLGLCQTVRMLYTVYKVAKEKLLPFDYTAGDNIGNFSLIADYSFATVLYLSSGVMFIPVLMRIIESSGEGNDKNSSLLVLFLILSFSLLLLVAFVYPLWAGYRMARKSKAKQVEILRGKREEEMASYCQNMDQQISDVEATALKEIGQNIKTKLEMTEKRLEMVEKVSIYPFQVLVIFKIATVVVIPTLMYFLQKIVIDGDWLRKILEKYVA